MVKRPDKNMKEFTNNNNTEFKALLEALKGTTNQPDGIESELVEGAVDGSYQQAYSDYVNEEMNTMLANRFN